MSPQIFIMDDEPEYGELIKDVAEMASLVAVANHDPVIFEEKMAGLSGIELIFLDLNMPNRDGIEILRALADMDFKGSIILMSGFDRSVLSTAHELAEAHNLSLLSPLKKPFSIQEILNIFSNHDFGLKAPVTSNANLNQNQSVMSIESILSALEGGGVCMHYQPQVSFKDYRVIGYESLVRLIDDHGELIYPGRFIEVIEQHGKTQLLLEKVIDKVLSDYQSHLYLLGEFTLSVNVSGLDLVRLDFPDELAKKVRATNFPFNKMVIEVTESRAMQQAKTGLDILARLRLKGFNLSIDDFGTGSAVLSNIKQMPFTELKIDKCFVDKLLIDDKTKSLTQDLINMGHHLNLSIVAEGIEDVQTAMLLREMGCDIAQGFYFARPMPAYNVVQWLKEQNTNTPKSIDSDSDSVDIDLIRVRPLNEQDLKTKSQLEKIIQNQQKLNPIFKKHNIGMILPLTGVLSSLGKVYFLGANMAYKKYSSEEDCSLHTYDSQSRSDVFSSILEGGIADDISTLFGGIFHLSDTENIAQQTSKKGLLYFAPYSGSTLLREDKYPHIINLKESYASELIQLLELAEKHGGNSCIIFNYPAMGRQLKKKIMSVFPKVNILFMNREIDGGLEEIINRLHSMDIDNVLFVGSRSLFLKVIKFYRALKETAYFYSTSLIPIASLYGLLNKTDRNIFIASPVPSLTARLPIVEEFQSCLAEHNIDSSKRFINSIALEGYISMKITLKLLAMMNEHESNSIDGFNEVLNASNAIDFGLRNSLHWDPENREFSNTTNIVEYCDGRWKLT